MNISVENVGEGGKVARVELPADRIQELHNQAVSEAQKAAKIPGFRPGKAPRHLVIRSHGKWIDESLQDRVIRTAVDAAVAEAKARVVGQPAVEVEQLSKGEGARVKVTLDVVPTFPLPNYKGLKARRSVALVNEVEVASGLKVLQDRRATFTDVTRPAQSGDVVVIHYSATSEGKPLTDFSPTARGLTAKRDQWMMVAPDSFLPGFTDPLIGASVGDKRTVTLTLPEDRVPKELAGREATYEVEVAGVKVREVPEVDDAFAVSWGADDLETLTEAIRGQMQRDRELQQRESVRGQLLDAVMSQVQFDVPPRIWENMTRSVVYEIVGENQRRGVESDIVEEHKDEILQSARETARKRIQVSIVLGEIARAEKIEVGQQEMLARLMAMAEQQQVKPDELIKRLRERNALGQVQQDVLQSKVLDFIEMNAQVEETFGQAEPSQAAGSGEPTQDPAPVNP